MKKLITTTKMAASTKENNTPNKLFTTADNSPLVFFMRPCAERQILKPLINEHGGQITSNLSPTCVKLAEKGSVVSSSDYLSSMYVKQCIKQNKLLEMDEFRIKPGTVAPQDLTSDDESTDSDISLSPADYIHKYKPTDLKGRRKYTKEDDIAIIRYLITEHLYHKTKGLTIWKDMERLEVLHHSAQSMNTRYRKVILPNIMSYSEDIQRSWISKLTGVAIPKTNSSYSVEDLFTKSDPEKKVTKTSEPKTSTATSTIDQDSRPSQKYQQLEFVSSSDKNEKLGDKTSSKNTSKYFSNKEAETGGNDSISSIKKFSPLKKVGAPTLKNREICSKSNTGKDHGKDGNTAKVSVNTIIPLIAKDSDINTRSGKDRKTENVSVNTADSLIAKDSNINKRADKDGYTLKVSVNTIIPLIAKDSDINTRSGKDRKTENVSVNTADSLITKDSNINKRADKDGKTLKVSVNTVIPLIAKDSNINTRSGKDRNIENISVNTADSLIAKDSNINTRSGKDRNTENVSVKIADALKAKYSYSKTRTVTRASNDTHFSAESAKVSSTVKDNEKPIQHSERKVNSPNIKKKIPDKSNANQVSDKRKRKRRFQNIGDTQGSSDNDEGLKEAMEDISLIQEDSDSASDIFKIPDSEVVIMDSQDCTENLEADSQCVELSLEQLDNEGSDDLINVTAETSDESRQLLLGPKTSTPHQYLVKRRSELAEEHIQRTEDCKAFCKDTSLKYDLKYETVHSLLFRCNGQITRVLGYIEYGPYSFQLPPWTTNDDHLLDDHQNIPNLILKYGQKDVNERLHFLEEL